MFFFYLFSLSLWYLIFSVWYLKCDIWCLFCWTGARWHQQHCAPWILIHRHFFSLVMMRQEFGRWRYLRFSDSQSLYLLPFIWNIWNIISWYLSNEFWFTATSSSLVMRQEFRWYLIFADYQNWYLLHNIWNIISWYLSKEFWFTITFFFSKW